MVTLEQAQKVMQLIAPVAKNYGYIAALHDDTLTKGEGVIIRVLLVPTIPATRDKAERLLGAIRAELRITALFTPSEGSMGTLSIGYECEYGVVELQVREYPPMVDDSNFFTQPHILKGWNEAYVEKMKERYGKAN